MPGWVCLCSSDVAAILAAEREAYGIMKARAEGVEVEVEGEEIDPILDPGSRPYGLWPSFTGAWAPEELYFPTVLETLGRLGGASDRQLTKASWNAKAKDWGKRANAEFLKFCKGDLIRWKGEGCVFARKFKGVEVGAWREAVYGSHEGGGEKRKR